MWLRLRSTTSRVWTARELQAPHMMEYASERAMMESVAAIQVVARLARSTRRRARLLASRVAAKTTTTTSRIAEDHVNANAPRGRSHPDIATFPERRKGPRAHGAATKSPRPARPRRKASQSLRATLTVPSRRVAGIQPTPLASYRRRGWFRWRTAWSLPAYRRTGLRM